MLRGMTATAQVGDGRTARREANRRRVVDAMLGLVDEGELEPTVEQVVARSGVSERSVFRYFDGLDDLRRAVIRQNFERVEPLMAVADLGVGPLDERVARFVESRIAVCEAVAGPARVGRRNAPFQPLVAEEVARFRVLLGRQVRAHFAPELGARTPAAADDLEAVVDVLVSFDAWDLLTTVHGRTRAQVRRAWTRSLLRLLEP